MLGSFVIKVAKSNAKGAVLISTLSSLAFASVSLLQPMLLSKLVRDYQGNVVEQKYEALALLAVVFLSCFVNGVSVLSEGTSVSRIKHVYQTEILDAVSSKSSLEDAAAFVQAMVRDVDIVSRYYVGLVSKILPALIMVIVSAIAVLRIDLLLTLVVVLLCAVVFFTVFLLSKRVGGAEQRVIDARNHLAEVLTYFARALSTVTLNSRGRPVKTQVERDLEANELRSIEAARWRAKAAPINSALLPIVATVVLGVASLRLSSGAISIDDLVAYIMYLFVLMTPLLHAVSLLGKRGEAVAAAKQVACYLTADASNASLPIEVQERIDKVLRDDFPALGIVIISGRSGVGKTSLLKQLARDLNRKDMTSIYVEQFPPKWIPDARASQTLYANADRAESFELVTQRLRIDKTMLERPMKDLSGGEQQRIAIAAALSAGVQVILLDEPTSAISEEDQLLLAKEINATSRLSKSIVIVTHDERFAQMLDADSRVRMK